MGTERKMKKGSVLGVCVVLILVLAFVGLGLARLGSDSRVKAVKTTVSIVARSAADAGLTQAAKLLKSEYAATGNPSHYNNNPEDLCTASEIHANETVTFAETTPGASYIYTVSFDPNTKWNNKGSYVVTSIGTAGLGQEKVYARLTRTNRMFGIGLERNLTVGNFGGFTATSTTDRPFTIKTNSTDADAITLNKEQTDVYGDIAVGDGGDPSVVIDHPEFVSGRVYASENYYYPPVVFPTGWDSWDVGPANYLINKNYRYSSISTTSNFEVGTVANPVHASVVVDGTMNLTGNKNEIIVNQGSSLSLYLKSLSGKNSITVTNKNANPTTLMIYVLGNGEIEFKNNTNIYAGIYAPSATVTFKNMNNNVFQGALIADNLVGDKINFCYDTLFDDFDLGIAVVPYRLEKIRWWED